MDLCKYPYKNDLGGSMLRLCLTWMAILSSAVSATDYSLVMDGKTEASIVLAEKPTRAAQLGAYELRHVVQLITGAELPILKGKLPASGLKIFVGNSSFTEMSGIDPKGFSREEYELKFGLDWIAMVGNDLPDFGTVSYSDEKTFPSCQYDLHSTLYAVYDFLEKCCGVRFYQPGDMGIAFRKSPTLIVQPYNIRRHPFMEAMRYPNWSGGERHGFSARDKHLTLLRWRANILYGQVNHNTFSIYFRYWKPSASKYYADLFIRSRPELFAQGYQGKFAPMGLRKWHWPDDPDLPPQLCQTNPETIRYYAEEAVSFYEGKPVKGAPFSPRKLPGCRFTYMIQEDDNHLICLCGNCASLMNCWKDKSELERKVRYHFAWVNSVAGEAAKKHPEIGIATLAYGVPWYPDLSIAKNVTVQLCIGVQGFYHPKFREEAMKIYDSWLENYAKKDGELFLWTYMLSPAFEANGHNAYHKFFPSFYPAQTIDIFKKFAKDGIRGWFGEIFVQYNFLEAYFAAKVCDDPSIDGKKALDEFYPLYYGPAADEMKEYFTIINKAFWSDSYAGMIPVRPDTAYMLYMQKEAVNWSLGTPSRLAALDALFRTAQRKAKGTPAEERLEWFDRTIHRQMMEGRKDFEKRELLRKVPTPECFVPEVGNADPASPKMARTVFPGQPVRLRTLDNEAGNDDIEISMAHDSSFLYVGFHERNIRSGKMSDDKWRNNVEIFLAAQRQMPYNHLLVTPAGLVENYRSETVNGVVRTGRSDIGAKLLSNECGKDWSFLLALPLDRLIPDRKTGSGDSFFMNILRTRCEAPNLSWSPLFTDSYLEGIYRMGRVRLAGGAPGVKEVSSVFTESFDVRKYWYPLNAAAKNTKIESTSAGLRLSTDPPALTYLFSSLTFPVSSLNTVTIQLIGAYGKGTAFAGLIGYSHFPDSPRGGPVFQNRRITLTEKSADYIVSIPVPDTKNEVVTDFRPFFGVDKESRLCVKEVRVSVSTKEILPKKKSGSSAGH